MRGWDGAKWRHPIRFFWGGQDGQINGALPVRNTQG